MGQSCFLPPIPVSIVSDKSSAAAFHHGADRHCPPYYGRGTLMRCSEEPHECNKDTNRMRTIDAPDAAALLNGKRRIFIIGAAAPAACTLFLPQDHNQVLKFQHQQACPPTNCTTNAPPIVATTPASVFSSNKATAGANGANGAGPTAVAPEVPKIMNSPKMIYLIEEMVSWLLWGAS
mmetsp:Transcript_18977/g.38984  ORF Transcript_18977/g.38984 Transcript_18977/m.38984 type:complete len:178 (-) Transcript_18977:107-640(-)